MYATKFFTETTVEAFPTQDVVTVDSGMAAMLSLFSQNCLDMKTVEAYSKLCEAKLHSVPVYDRHKATYVGFFDVADMVSYVVETLRKTSEPGAEAADTFMNLKDLVEQVNRLVPDAAGSTSNFSHVCHVLLSACACQASSVCLL